MLTETGNSVWTGAECLELVCVTYGRGGEEKGTTPKAECRICGTQLVISHFL